MVRLESTAYSSVVARASGRLAAPAPAPTSSTVPRGVRAAMARSQEIPTGWAT